jgi:hypothetical protein
MSLLTQLQPQEKEGCVVLVKRYQLQNRSWLLLSGEVQDMEEEEDISRFCTKIFSKK